MTNVFLSRPTWIPPQFSRGVDGFIGLLRGLELNPRTLGTTDYPSRAPLDEVIDLMKKCRGAVILGIPQITITAGTIKDQALENPLQLPTEWNHIEAGLAYSQGLPLLVIHHQGVRRGIFDRGATPTFLYERDLGDPAWPLANDLQGALRHWKEQCVLNTRASSTKRVAIDLVAALDKFTNLERQVLRCFIEKDSKTAAFSRGDGWSPAADTAHSLAVRGFLYLLAERRNLWFTEMTYGIQDPVFEHLREHPELLEQR
jgi:hypothetical protein